MTVEIIEKGDGTITVKFTATSPHEAVILSMASGGRCADNASLSTGTSGYGSKAGTVTFGSFSVPVIAQLDNPKPKG